MADLDANSSLRQNLIDDAEYVAAELARGDAVPAGVLVKAKPYIDPVMTALIAAKAAQSPGDPEYCKLQAAMVDLMTAIAPVTVGSLKDTKTPATPRHCLFIVRWAANLFGVTGSEDTSPAERFGGGLMVMSVLFLLAALGCTLAIALVTDNSLFDSIKEMMEPNPVAYDKMTAALHERLLHHIPGRFEALVALQTILYGGLGACVFLLRALHKHIHERTFDRRFRPEYYNRIVLGVVSGGVITVLISADGSQASTALKGVSVAALAFLIGYNTDLLFSLIERISNALFPKVPDPPAPDAAVMPAALPKKAGDDDKPDGKPNGKPDGK